MTEYSHDTEHELNEEGNSGNDKDSSGDDINNNPELETEGKDSTKKVSAEELQKIIQEYENSSSAFQYDEVLEDYENDIDTV
ncbi:Uncharacterised protein [Chlamydia trachomatis]|nr:Uncharacterised protein [Chlamydia trachomatis]